MRNKKLDQLFMKKTINRARKGVSQGQTPFGACIVIDDKLIAVENNQVWANIDITAHAEINAIRSACKKLKSISLRGATLYSTCEPCPMCFAAAHWAGISTIVFGAGINDAKKIGFNELSISNLKMKRLGMSKIKLIKNVLLKENIALFKLWTDLAVNKVY
jgi:guanine deaminase